MNLPPFSRYLLSTKTMNMDLNHFNLRVKYPALLGHADGRVSIKSILTPLANSCTVITLTDDGLGIIPVSPNVARRCQRNFPRQTWYTPGQIYIVLMEISPKNTQKSKLGRLLWAIMRYKDSDPSFRSTHEGAMNKIAMNLQATVSVWPDLKSFDEGDPTQEESKECILESIIPFYDSNKMIVDDMWEIRFSFLDLWDDFPKIGHLLEISRSFASSF